MQSLPIPKIARASACLGFIVVMSMASISCEETRGGATQDRRTEGDSKPSRWQQKIAQQTRDATSEPEPTAQRPSAPVEKSGESAGDDGRTSRQQSAPNLTLVTAKPRNTAALQQPDAQPQASGSGRNEQTPRAKSTEKSGNEKSGNEKSGTEKSGTEKSGTEKSGTEKSGTEKTGNEKTGNEKTGNEKTGNEKSGNENESDNVVHTVRLPVNEDLIEITTVGPSTAMVGEACEYEIRVKNLAKNLILHHVRVRQLSSKKFGVESSDPPMEKSEDQNGESEIVWLIPALAPGQSKTIRVTATSHEEGSARTCMDVSYTPAVCLKTRFLKPELALHRIAPNSTTICKDFEYQYKLENQGSGPARDVHLQEELPEGLTTVEGDSKIEFRVDELAANQSKELSVRLVAQRKGQFTSKTKISGKNVKDVESKPHTVEVLQPELDVAFDGPEVANIRRKAEYRVQVVNRGDAPAEDAELTLSIGEGVALSGMSLKKDGESPQEISPAESSNDPSDKQKTDKNWRLGDLAPGASVELIYYATVDRPGVASFEATASFTCGKETKQKAVAAQNSAEWMTDIVALPALRLTVVDHQDPIRVGGEVIYKIRVTNQGDAKDENVKIAATLPEAAQLLDAQGASKSKESGKRIEFNALDSLDAGKSATWTIRAKPTSAGDVLLAVELTSKSFNQKFTAQEPTRFFESTASRMKNGQSSSAKNGQENRTPTPASIEKDAATEKRPNTEEEDAADKPQDNEDSGSGADPRDATDKEGTDKEAKRKDTGDEPADTRKENATDPPQAEENNGPTDESKETGEAGASDANSKET